VRHGITQVRRPVRMARGWKDSAATLVGRRRDTGRFIQVLNHPPAELLAHLIAHMEAQKGLWGA
jgi:hypothetical protein